jgi:hypothetical protein
MSSTDQRSFLEQPSSPVSQAEIGDKRDLLPSPSRRRAGGEGNSSIHLNIDSIVLHDFPPSDRFRIGAAIEAELTRLFNDRLPPSFSQGGQLDQLDGGLFEIAIDTKAEALGIQIARAIYGGLSR